MKTEFKLDVEKEQESVFWTVKKVLNKETNKMVFKELVIDGEKLIYFLLNQGYRCLYIAEKYTLVQIVDRKVKEVDRFHIIHFMLHYIDNLKSQPDPDEKKVTKDLIRRKFRDSIQWHMKPDRLYTLVSHEDVLFNKDTYSEKYMYFKNGILLITKDGIQLIQYKDLKKHIWENEVIDHEIKLTPKSKTLGVFEQFMFNISDVTRPGRFKTLKRLTGYLIHDFYEYKLKAAVFTDSRISNGEANGRTGKTLYTKALGYAISSNPKDPSNRVCVDINGKSFDPRNKHRYELVKPQTKLVSINDLKQNFQIDLVYNDVTEGLDVDPKAKTPYRAYVKLLLNTNRTLRIEGESDKDRFTEFEFADYYSSSLTPQDEFKHWFFRDWKHKEWNDFYLLMASCVEDFFKSGYSLTDAEPINLHLRKLNEQVGEDLTAFMENLKIVSGKEYFTQELFNNFTELFPDYSKWTATRFKSKLKSFTKYHPDYMEHNKERDDFRKDSKRGIRFFKKQNNEKTV